nr:glycosyltransferase [uncultured Allomuricauda sp.]
MKVLLTSVGTRGDIEPFLTIANMLHQKGHNVLCCFPEQFKKMTIDMEIPFISLGKEYLELLDTKEGKSVMGGKVNFFEKLKAYYHLYRKSSHVNRLIAKRQKDIIADFRPDRVVFHIKSIYPLIWGVENPKKVVLVSPIPYLVHYTKTQGHIGFNKDHGVFLNKLTYRLSNFALLKNVLSVTKQMDSCIQVSYGLLKKTMLSIKMVFTISPTLFPKPQYWSDHIQILGHHSITTSKIWKPDRSLEQFLQRHEKILFVTFGSMTNDSPREKTKAILDIVQEYNIPTIVNTSSGGLITINEYNPELIYYVSNIPYEYIFPKIYAVIHHGGSGTTHLALKHGCPSLIISHIIDQHMWAKLVHRMGTGPKSITISKMNSKKLESKILSLFQNNVYKIMAEEIGSSMKEEDFKEDLIQFLTITKKD